MGIVIKSDEKRLVYGEVYAPLHVDTDTEAMTAPEIEKMAHNFLASRRTDKIDVSHNWEESGCRVVESFIARKNDPDGFVEGSWVLGVKIIPDRLWVAVKKGDLNGFSFAGRPGGRTEAQVIITQTKKIVGDTEKNTDDLVPPHEHAVDLLFDSNGRIIPTATKETMGHVHPVRKATATEEEIGHSHRLILIDNP
jgi:hypothetical protein